MESPDDLDALRAALDPQFMSSPHQGTALLRIVELNFRREHVEEFILLFDQNKNHISASEGCRFVYLLRTDSTFFTLSGWERPEDLETYRTSALFVGVWKQTRSWLSQPARAWSCRLMAFAPGLGPSGTGDFASGDSASVMMVTGDSPSGITASGGSASQPPPAGESASQPQLAEDTVSQPPTAGDSVSHPPPAGESASQPPTAGETASQPPTAGESASQPPPTGESASQPPPAGESASQPPSTGVFASQPPPAGDSASQPPPAGKSVSGKQ